MKDAVTIQVCFHSHGFNITNIKRGNNMRDTNCGRWQRLRKMVDLDIITSRSAHRAAGPHSSGQHYDERNRPPTVVGLDLSGSGI